MGNNVYQDLKGTASELKDNRDFDKLVKKVGEYGAVQAIQSKLNERGIPIDKWRSYREVRSKLHENPLKVREDLKDIDDLTNGIVGDA
jgi:hypothetical protein